MILGENNLSLMINIKMDINEHQDQTFTSRSNINVCDNNGHELYLLGILTKREPYKPTHTWV